jgi:hypothetical protein
VAGITKLHVMVAGLIVMASPVFDAPAAGQVAYVPEIGFIPSGATMTVVPAVSADRRYVRLSVNAFFNELNSLQTFSFPGGAVSNGGFFGGFGGMNGVMGGGGGGVGGGGGAVGGAGGAGVAIDPGLLGVSLSGYAAGPAPLDGELGEFFAPFIGDPLLDANNAAPPGTGRDAALATNRGLPVADSALARARGGHGARAAKQPVDRQRPKPARKPSRGPAAKSRRSGQ